MLVFIIETSIKTNRDKVVLNENRLIAYVKNLIEMIKTTS